MLQVDPRQIGRLAELVKNLQDRLEEAEMHGWGGEIEGIKASLEAGRAKLAAARRFAAKPQVRPDRPGHPDDPSQELTLKALRIDTNGDLAEVDLPDNDADRFVAAVRELVGAPGIQVLGLTNRWDAWLDEDSVTTGRTVNKLATGLAHHYGIPANLRGTIVVTGVDRDAGIAKSLTPKQISTIRHRIADR